MKKQSGTSMIQKRYISPSAAKRAAVQFVRRMGIRPNLNGYYYLISAIELGVQCPNLLDSLTQELYPAVARCYNVKNCTIERSIRQAIQSAYDNDPKRIRSMFYYKTGKPYASETIALGIDSILLKH